MRERPRRSWAVCGTRPLIPQSSRTSRATSGFYRAMSSAPQEWTAHCRMEIRKRRRRPCSAIWTESADSDCWWTKMEETLYFAYGSNINLEQMEHRCPDAQLVGPVTLQNYELQFRGSGFATVSPKKGSVVHGLLWKLTPKSEQALDRYEGYPRHYTKEQVSVRTTDDAAVSVMAYIMAEPMSRQPALPSPYYYRAIQQGFEANGLPVESLEEAWNRTIDEIWLGKVERLKNGKNLQTRKPER